MKKILISVGEVSGDKHAAELLTHLRHLNPNLTFIGSGGEALKKVGLQPVVDITPFSTVGFIEPIVFARKIIQALNKMKRLMDEEKPDLFIPVDYQGFNLLLCKEAKKRGIPVAYYIAPQEWQWGTEKGGRKVVQNTDLILSIFKEEESFYTALSGHAVFVGNPLVDLTKPTGSLLDIRHRLGLKPNDKLLTIFPGSRPQELKHVGPIFYEASAWVQDHMPDWRIAISVAADHLKPQLLKGIEQAGIKHPILFKGPSPDIISASELSFVSSGTVTLEHAMLGVPCISGYKFSRLSFLLAKWLIGKKFEKMKYMSLPNLYLKEEVIPEFLQDNLTVDHVLQAFNSLVSNPDKYYKMKDDFKRVRTIMGEEGAVKRAAEVIHQFLENLDRKP